MTILIRLDITKKIGTGHFRRMLNLSQSMPDYKFIFAIKTDEQSNSIFNDLNIMFIENDVDFMNILNTTKINLLIVDLLCYEKNYIQNIKNILTCPIVTFHEYDDYTEFSDLIINYNFLEMKQENNTDKFLFGPQYIIFSDDMINYQNQVKQNYIFVSFGGSDPSGLTEMFINEVVQKLPDFQFKIHIGSFKQSRLKEFINIEYLYQPDDIFKYMSSAKLAVTAAGNMMYELIYFQVPSVVIAHNKHQARFAQNAYNNGCIEYFGTVDEFEPNQLIEKILIAENMKYKYNKIDFNGKARIIKAIEELL